MPDFGMDAEVIVAGAGPAGSAAAAVLGEAGKRVLLLDKSVFPREKTCGDAMTLKCLPLLRRLGIEGEFLRQARFAAKGYTLYFTDRIELTVRRTFQGDASILYILARHDFDQLVLSAALRHPNVQFRPENKIRELVRSDSGGKTGGERIGVRVDHAGTQRTYYAPLVIDATGVNSPLSIQVGAGNQDPHRCALALRGYYEDVAHLNDTIELYLTNEILPGYLWIFPTSPTSANVGCGTFQHIVEERHLDLRRVLDEAITRSPALRRKLGQARSCGHFKGGRIPLAIGGTTSRVRDGLLLTGDAGAFTDPITAEGISQALHTGILAAETALVALEQGDCSAARLSAYDEAWRTQLGKMFARAPILTTSLTRDQLLRSLTASFNESQGINGALGNLGSQYELMVKMKALMKAL